jgi:hypothetical protein
MENFFKPDAQPKFWKSIQPEKIVQMSQKAYFNFMKE